MSRDLEIYNQPASIESYADNLQSKLQVAGLLLKSGMLPSHYKTPEAVLTAILYGRELGFSPIRALNSITVIQGRPTLEAQALKALAIAHGGIIKTVEWTDRVCTLECTRGVWTDTATYTLDDAARAGLTTKENWKKMPRAMLYARAVSIVVRNMFADVLGGLYSREEVQDDETLSAEVVETKSKRVRGKPATPRDDAPAWLEAPKVDRLAAIRNAIDGEDWFSVGNHVIETKCSLQGMSVREALDTKRETLVANIKRFTSEADRLAVTAMVEAFPVVSKTQIEATGEVVFTDEDLEVVA